MKRMKRDRVRFWTFENGGWVRITLEDRKRIFHYHRAPTDEGWSSSESEWEYSAEDGRVYQWSMTDGVDCDGRMSRHWEGYARADELRAVECYGGEDTDPAGVVIRRPEWRELDRGQRDYQAEAAGY